MPFRLNNIADFVVGPHPLIYPESEQYDEYWTRQAQRCIEGHWGHDYAKGSGGYRWMPGNLYFYTNMGIIEAGGDENTKLKSSPLLRDIEWLVFYGLAVCDGFSGFVDDPEFCCFRPVGKLENNIELSEMDKIFLERFEHLYRTKRGFKKYIEPKQYLYRTTPEALGSGVYHNTALNFEILSTRRLGKSFSVGEGVICYDFTFNGARNLVDYLEKKTTSSVVIGSVDYKYSAELINKVELCYEHLRTDIGAYNKDGLSYNGVFWHPSDGMGKIFKQKGGVVSNSVQSKSGQGSEGVGSKLIHVSYKDNPNAGVGYGARRMITEESGLLSNFNAVHGENSATQKHDYKYGYSIYIGTGGNIEKIKEIKDSFYNPGKYEILGYPNLFNPGGADTALFIPSYYKNNLFRDDDGNLDINRSFIYEMSERDKARGGKNYQSHTISFPIIPDEMFLKSAGNRFNTEMLEDRIIELENGQHRYSVGTLTYVDEANKKVAWKEDIDKKLIPFLRRGDEHKEPNKQGAVVVYEHPQSYKPDRYSKNPLYLAIYDSVAISGEEGGTGSSLCAVIVLKLYDFNDSYYMMNIVCEWYGRYNSMDDNHKEAFKIADYYGCKLFPEVNLEDVLRYAKRIRRYDDLEDWPDFSATEISAQKRKYVKGFRVPPQGKPKLEEFLNEYLDIEVYKEEHLEGEDYKVNTVKVINRIPSIRACEELKEYNSEDNFDAVSCLFLGALWVRNKRLKPINEELDQLDEDDIKEFNSIFADSYNSGDRHPAFHY